MKNKLFITAALLLMTVVVFVGYAPELTGRTAEIQTSGNLVTVLNPAIATAEADRIPLIPRLDTLEGKTLYLIDIQWGGPDAAYSVYEEIRDWFSRNMPSVNVVLKRTTSNMFSDDPSLRKEITAQKVDAAMVGIAG